MTSWIKKEMIAVYPWRLGKKHCIMRPPSLLDSYICGPDATFADSQAEKACALRVCMKTVPGPACACKQIIIT